MIPGLPTVHRTNPVMQANARLIAAAPDLLAACREASSLVDDGQWAKARDLLAEAVGKATGEQPDEPDGAGADPDYDAPTLTEQCDNAWKAKRDG